MKSFSDFNIIQQTKGFEGEKLKISKVLNREIIICDFKIDDSKFKEKGTGKCLQLQISVNNIKHIVFTGSSGLMDAIKQIPKEYFPFTTTIIEENDRFRFT
jgi:hypothetical protein